MGTAIVVFHQAGNRSLERNTMPVIRLPEARAQVMITSTVSKQTTIDADGTRLYNVVDGGFVTIMALGSNMWVTCGPDPVAVFPTADGPVGEGYPIREGYSVSFGVNEDDKIAIVDWE